MIRVRVCNDVDTRDKSKAMGKENITVALVGDSHSRQLATYLTDNAHAGSNHINWQLFEDGTGIYHNIVPDRQLKCYLNRSKGVDLHLGKILANLAKDVTANRGYSSGWDGRHSADVIMFQSGQWDLRDLDVDQYNSNLNELFIAIAAFRDRHPGIKVVWSGVPPYSHQRKSWGGLERRTNLKLMLGDRHAHALANHYRIQALPFFELALPFYLESCDSHHYICPGAEATHPEINKIGIVHARWAVHVACSMLR